MKIKTQLLKWYLWAILTYGCEDTNIADGNQNQRRGNVIFKAGANSSNQQGSGEESWNTKRELLAAITKRQHGFLGHFVSS